MRVVLLFLSLSQIHSLKLLSLESEESAAAQDWEWESDIKFSYKPLSGLCKEEDGTTAPAKTSGDPGKFEAGKLSKTAAVEETVGAVDFKTYITASGKTKMFEVLNAWVKILLALKNLVQLPHIIAKLCAMNMLMETDAKAAIKAFDVNMVSGAYNIYAEVADKGNLAANIFCYIEAVMMWVKNDPKVKNMDGEEFEIMATGTFSLVSLKYRDTHKTALELLSTIDRAGT
jgi:hypothetical protein